MLLLFGEKANEKIKYNAAPVEQCLMMSWRLAHIVAPYICEGQKRHT